jgi:hypothetical protein
MKNKKNLDGSAPNDSTNLTASTHAQCYHMQTILMQLKKKLATKDPILAAAAFAGLGVIGELQSNHFRIANLIHSALKFGYGQDDIEKDSIEYFFSIFENSEISLAEDPAEDVFISRICTSEASYKIYEGGWEHAGWYLECFMSAIRMFSDNEHYETIKLSAVALLRLSNFIATRSRVNVNTVTGRIPRRKICPNLFTPAALRNKVHFDENDLDNLGIKREHITPFMFEVHQAKKIRLPLRDILSPLDKFPIIKGCNSSFYLYPQGVSTAIRNYLIKAFTKNRKDRKNLAKGLVLSQQKWIINGNILGARKLPFIEAVHFVEAKDFVKEYVFEVSKSRVLHTILLFDDMEGDLDNWPQKQSKALNGNKIKLLERIELVKLSVKKHGFLKPGATLVILCGWGRNADFSYPLIDCDDWSICFITMGDFVTLSEHPKMQPLHLWRIIEAEKKLQEVGGRVINLNGLLNLYGHMLSNNCQIVRPEILPQKILSGKLDILIPTRCIADIRESSKQKLDRKIIYDLDEGPVEVVKYSGEAYFLEDKAIPLYLNQDSVNKGTLSGAFIGQKSVWWCKVKSPERALISFLVWKSAMAMMPKLYHAICENGFCLQGTIGWYINVKEIDNKNLKNEEKIYSKRITPRRITTSIVLSPGGGVFSQPGNEGERKIAMSFIGGLLDINSCDLHSLCAKIFPDKYAKNIHSFPKQIFNDHITNLLPKAVYVEDLDAANLHLGLGWLKDDTLGFLKIQGISECRERLNKVVKNVWIQLKEKLRFLGKRKLCKAALLNLESLQKEKNIWKRTIRANIACHDNKKNVKEVAIDKLSSLNTAILTSRLLIEIAICTCPNLGADVDEFDLSQLLTNVYMLCHFGACSDAINYELYPPELNISYFGQIMMNYDFDEQILQPYQSDIAEELLTKDAKNYEKLYQVVADPSPAHNTVPNEFLEAWQDEYGVAFDIMRKIIDIIEDRAIESNKVFFEERRSTFLKFLHSCIKPISLHNVQQLVSNLSLLSRRKWNQETTELPEGMASKDWYPWNFKRKLSLLSKPLIELDAADDPLILVSPGRVRESIRYLMHNAFYGTFDERNFSSKKMRKWIGNQRNKLGIEFNKSVASKMKELGWEVDNDVLITKILNTKTECDFGDIDVLAWSEQLGIVLALECKNLSFARTHRELGNQIREFRGLCDSSGKKDRLRKHFDRLNLLALEFDALKRFTKCRNIDRLAGALVFSHSNIIERAPQIPRDKLYICNIDSLCSPPEFSSKLILWEKDTI